MRTLYIKRLWICRCISENHGWNHCFAFNRVWLPVCVFFTSALSYAASLGKLPYQQLCYSPRCSLLVADSMSRRDSSWDEASLLIPSPAFLLSFLHTPSVHQLSVCVPASLALTGWLESHSGTVAPRPKQDLMSIDTLFSLFPLPHGDHLWYVWSYIRLPITGDVDWVSAQWDFCIRFKHLYNLHHFFLVKHYLNKTWQTLWQQPWCWKQRRSCFVCKYCNLHLCYAYSSACFIYLILCFSAFPRILSDKLNVNSCGAETWCLDANQI